MERNDHQNFFKIRQPDNFHDFGKHLPFKLKNFAVQEIIKVDGLILISTHLWTFYTQRLGNRVHFMFMCTFSVVVS